MRNVLVTGGKGFIGTHLVRRMRKSPIGYDVTIFDRDGYTGIERESWDGIVHLAAVARISDCEKDPVECMKSNLALTAEVLKKRTKWIIFSSTISPATTTYGLSKCWGEQLLYYWTERRGIGLRVFRFASVHGEGENADKLLPRAIEAARKGIPLPLSDTALPMKYVSLDRVVDEIMVAMSDLHHFPTKIHAQRDLIDGTIKTRKQLMEFAENVVHSDAQPA